MTLALYRDGGLNRFQKIGQTALVWMLPIVGALSILMLIASHHTRREMKSLVPYPIYFVASEGIRYRDGPKDIMNSDLTGNELVDAADFDGD